MPAPSAALTRSVALLERLIAFPTVSSASNLALIEHVAEMLHRLGATVSLSHAPDGAKANLFATLGPDVDDGVVLSGHTATWCPWWGSTGTAVRSRRWRVTGASTAAGPAT